MHRLVCILAAALAVAVAPASVRADDAAPARPQRPQPPFPYRSSEVTFRNDHDGVSLAGTVTVPDGKGPFPGVVLLSGATAQTRDGTLFDHPTMLVLADHLSRHGIAVLRFDDRGTGGSGGDFAAANAKDQAGDLAAGAALLGALPEVDAGRVGVAAHSQGCAAAALAATGDGIAFLVLLGPSGLPPLDLVVDQTEEMSRAMGLPAPVAELNGRIYGELARIAATEPDRDAAEAAMRAAVRGELDGLPDDVVAVARQIFSDATVGAVIAELTGPAMRYLLTHDPRETLRRVTVPTLVLIGGTDRQIRADRHLPAIASALSEGGNRNVTVRELPGLNHFFQESESGSPAEFAAIEQTMAPAALDAISTWVAER